MYFIKHAILFVFLLNLFSHSISNAINSDPIVLVHGFSGWGRNDLKGFRYWGGFNDLQEDLKYQGNKIFTASVGAFSSNYDRAVELYAQIKGTCVDYGIAHSQKYGHARFGKCYADALFPEWDENHKIHFVGHSQGGQTIRTLLQLLKEGSLDELKINNIDQSELFSGNKNWVTSITTISTPNNGTTLTNITDVVIPRIQTLISYFAAIIGINKNSTFDFKLDQWGMRRAQNESLEDYFYKVMQSNIWNTKDISKWDLSPEGAKEFNNQDKIYNDVYYFSISTMSTLNTNPINNCRFSPFNFLSIPAKFIGCFAQDKIGKINIDSQWFANDGIVNTNSMAAPFNMPKDIYNGTAKLGTWNDLGTKHGWNHIDIIAALPNLLKPYNTVKQIYSDHVNFLHSL